MAASHPNVAISDTFGDASDAVMPTSALVIPAASRTNALADEAKSASAPTLTISLMQQRWWGIWRSTVVPSLWDPKETSP